MIDRPRPRSRIYVKSCAEIANPRRWQEILFFGGFGHDVAGFGGQASAFELHGGVFDVKLFCGDLTDGFHQTLAFVHVHVGNACVEAESIVAAA